MAKLEMARPFRNDVFSKVFTSEGEQRDPEGSISTQYKWCLSKLGSSGLSLTGSIIG